MIVLALSTIYTTFLLLEGEEPHSFRFHKISAWSYLDLCPNFYEFNEGAVVLRRNPPDVGVTSGQKSCTKIIYIALQTSVGLF